MTDHHGTPAPDPDSAQTEDVIDSGQSEDIKNSLTGQGVSDRATMDDEL